MESIEKNIENYAIVFYVNLLRATLNEAGEFKDYLEDAIFDTDKDIIVDLSSCEHLDSTFLGVLVSAYKRLKNQNRNLVIIEPVDQSSIFLTLNSIGKIFPLYTSVKNALDDIENKKLLEKEINELGPITMKKKETFQKPTFTISSRSTKDYREEPMLDELNSTKDFETPINNEKPDLINPLSTKNLPPDEDLVLIENKSETDDHENILSLNPDESATPEENNLNSDPDKEKLDSDIISKSETVTSEKDFKKGTVDWKFGF